MLEDLKLKQGEEVVVSNWRGLGGSAVIRTVRKVSATGIVTVIGFGTSEMTFRADGRGRGKASAYEIRRVTDEDREKLERRELLSEITGVCSDAWALLPIEALRAVAEAGQQANALYKARKT